MEVCMCVEISAPTSNKTIIVAPWPLGRFNKLRPMLLPLNSGDERSHVCELVYL
jgi:hypothetical protein